MTRSESTPSDEDVPIGGGPDPSGRSTVSRGRKTVYAAVMLLLVGGFLELAGQLFYATRTRADTYLSQAYYRRRDWSRDYLGAQDHLTLRYEPYVGWRRADCRTRFLNITHGERRTVHPVEPSSDAVVIWCFGGSTMWGTGVRDAHTIPSHLARIAHEAGYDVRVRNLGESGWVSTQEVLHLILKVRSGETPDLAVFYDGINDVFAAYQSGRGDGAHQNLDIFENYFNRGFDPRRRFRNKIALYRLAKAVTRRLGLGWRSAAFDPRNADSLAGRLVDTYLRNTDLAARVAKTYGFDTVFFWQPMIVFQPDYRNTERDAYRRGEKKGMDAMLEFYKTATARLADRGPIDLTRCLGPSPPEGYYIDHNHLNEEGNAVVAAAIFGHLRDRIGLHHRNRPVPSRFSASKADQSK